MTNHNNTSIDLEHLQPVTPAGLSGPRNKTAYTDPIVQQVLTESFDKSFPLIQSSTSGIQYTSLDEKTRNQLQKATPVVNIEDIPKGELLRLMEGWMRIRRRITEEQFPKGVQSILLNLKVPSPRSSIQQYLLYKNGEQKKLFVLWAYESKQEPHIPLEKALSFFLDVPLTHLQSILTTSLSKQTASVTSAVNMNTTTVQYLRDPSQAPSPHMEPIRSSAWKTFAMMTGAAAITFFGYVMFQQTKNSNELTLSSPAEPLPTNPVVIESQTTSFSDQTIEPMTEHEIIITESPIIETEPSDQSQSETALLASTENDTASINLTDMIPPKEISSDLSPTSSQVEVDISLDAMMQNTQEPRTASLQHMLAQ